MEDNNKNEGIEASQEESSERPVHYTKQQSFFYTVISVALFFLIYFAVKGIAGTANRPYQMFAYPENITAERAAEAFAISGISQESDLVFENARLEKNSDGYVLMMLFSGNGDAESFADEEISFEYGDAEEDIRTEFYPYAENYYYAEYAYAEKYVDIEAPSREIYIFEWKGRLYAEYRQYGSSIPSEIKTLFSGMEKVY